MSRAPNTAADLRAQYSTSDKLAARARLHRNYTETDEPWFEWLVARMDIRPGARILDIGCGPGWFWGATTAQLPANLDLTLADQSQGMVDEALARVGATPGWTVRSDRADITALPYPDASFDAVVAMHMLYHVPDPADGIAEIFRVLKPGGTALVTTNGTDNLRAFYALGAEAFGVPAGEPVAEIFGIHIAERLLSAQFGNVHCERHPGRLRITEPLDVFLALTSYPPGDTATDAQLTTLQQLIDTAFANGNGELVSEKDVALLVSRKSP